MWECSLYRTTETIQDINIRGFVLMDHKAHLSVQVSSFNGRNSAKEYAASVVAHLSTCACCCSVTNVILSHLKLLVYCGWCLTLALLSSSVSDIFGPDPVASTEWVFLLSFPLSKKVMFCVFLICSLFSVQLSEQVFCADFKLENHHQLLGHLIYVQALESIRIRIFYFFLF